MISPGVFVKKRWATMVGVCFFWGGMGWESKMDKNCRVSVGIFC